MIFRFIFSFFLFIGIFLLPWWLIAILALVGSILWNPYYEVILAGFAYDLFYAVQVDKFFGFTFVGLTAALLFFMTGIFLSRHLRSLDNFFRT